MSWLSEFMHPGRAYKDAQKEAEKYYQQSQGYYEPYNERGQRAGGTLEDLLAQYMNPVDLQNQWAQSYEMSPYAQQLQKEAQSQGLDAASSMGLMGSSAALNNIQRGASDIMSKDRQQYMNDLMQKFMQAIGIGENLYGTGANAAFNQGQNAMHQGENMAGLKYGEHSAGANRLATIGSGIGQLATSYFNRPK